MREGPVRCCQAIDRSIQPPQIAFGEQAQVCGTPTQRWRFQAALQLLFLRTVTGEDDFEFMR
jgi:hypothetical protein